MSHDGQDDWANAVFVSPSPFYAADIVYSERITSLKECYCCLVEAFVKEGNYKMAASTLFARKLQA